MSLYRWIGRGVYASRQDHHARTVLSSSRGALEKSRVFGTSARNLPLPRLKVRENLPLTSIAYDRTSHEVLKSYGHPRSCEEAARYGPHPFLCKTLLMGKLSAWQSYNFSTPTTKILYNNLRRKSETLSKRQKNISLFPLGSSQWHFLNCLVSRLSFHWQCDVHTAQTSLGDPRARPGGPKMFPPDQWDSRWKDGRGCNSGSQD